MKTIAIYSGYFIPHLGGIERYVDNLSKEFIDAGHKVIIISSNYDDFPSFEEHENLTLIRVPIFNIFKGRYPIPKKNKEYRKIIKFLNSVDIDYIIVNTRFHLTSLIGAKYGKKRGIPVFLIEHGSLHLTVDNKVLDFFGAIYEHCLTNYIKKYVDGFYGVSKECCNWQKHFGINSNGVWYNSINMFNKEKIEKDDKVINILYAGRILRQKGVIELIESFLEIGKERKNINLFIAGEGNLLPELKNKYKNKNIVFLGKLNFEQLIEQYKTANIFAYPSFYPEGLPTSILEAGLMKCAVIGTPFGGTKEVIEDGKTGIMVENQEQLTAALTKLIDSKEKREEYSEALYKKITNQFVWGKTAKKIMKDMDNFKRD